MVPPNPNILDVNLDGEFYDFILEYFIYIFDRGDINVLKTNFLPKMDRCFYVFSFLNCGRFTQYVFYLSVGVLEYLKRKMLSLFLLLTGLIIFSAIQRQYQTFIISYLP